MHSSQLLGRSCSSSELSKDLEKFIFLVRSCMTAAAAAGGGEDVFSTVVILRMMVTRVLLLLWMFLVDRERLRRHVVVSALYCKLKSTGLEVRWMDGDYCNQKTPCSRNNVVRSIYLPMRQPCTRVGGRMFPCL